MTPPGPTVGPPLELRLRRWRNGRILVVTLPLAVATVWALSRPDVGLGPWAVVFPALAAHGLYRLWRPPVPLAVDTAGLTVSVGMPLIGMHTTIPWDAVARIRTSAGGQLLVELRDGSSWLERQPWGTRANVRANRRRAGAAVALPLRELQAPHGGLLPALREAAPVPVGTAGDRGNDRRSGRGSDRKRGRNSARSRR